MFAAYRKIDSPNCQNGSRLTFQCLFIDLWSAILWARRHSDDGVEYIYMVENMDFPLELDLNSPLGYNLYSPA